MDPLVIAYDHDSQTVEPSGVITFHGDFPGRTEIEDYSVNIPLEQLRSSVKTKELTFDEAIPRFTTTMHHVAEQYRKHIDKKNS